MAVVERKRKSGTVFGVVNEWNGKPAWELVGPNRREAEIRDRAMKREIATGTYVPISGARATTVAQYVETWGNALTNPSAKDDRRCLRLYVASRPWLAEMRLDEWKPIPHTARLIDELQAERKPNGSRRLTDKTIANCLGVLHRMFKTAILADLCVRQPIVYEPGRLDLSPSKDVEIYEKSEVRALTRHKGIPWPIRILNGFCSLAGLREGEAVGAKVGELDLSPDCLPLGALVVRRQYEGRKLKTRRPRVVPIHPELRALLEDWLSHGFELYTGRRPTPEDFIVPNVSARAKAPHHTRSTYYKAFVKACAAAGVRARSLHATRHTFTTLCRRAGARSDVLEKVTHNAKGAMIDRYTHFDWEPLCEAVLCLNLDVHRSVHRGPKTPGNSGQQQETATGHNSAEPFGTGSAALGSIPGASTELRAKNSQNEKTRQGARQESEAALADLRAAENRVLRSKARLQVARVAAREALANREFQAKARAWFARGAAA